MRKELFIDIETNNSLDPKTGTITQLSFIYRENGKIKDIKDFKNNIYEQFLIFLNHKIDRFNPKDKMYFIAYNAKFDNDFVRELFLKHNNKFYGSYFYNPVIDVMQIAAYKVLLSEKRPDNFKLSSICKHFKINVNEENLHDSLYDVTLTKDLFNKLKKIK